MSEFERTKPHINVGHINDGRNNSGKTMLAAALTAILTAEHKRQSENKQKEPTHAPE